MFMLTYDYFNEIVILALHFDTHIFLVYHQFLFSIYLPKS